MISKISLDEVFHALEESVAIQSHYASILNSYDNGSRITFFNAEEWIMRLREIKKIRKEQENDKSKND